MSNARKRIIAVEHVRRGIGTGIVKTARRFALRYARWAERRPC